MDINMNNLIVNSVSEIQAVKNGQITIVPEADGNVGKASVSKDGRPQIPLHGPYREMCDFAADVGKAIRPENVLFVRGDVVVVVREKQVVQKIKTTDFHPLGPIEARCAIQDYVQVVRKSKSADGSENIIPETMSAEVANALLQSPQFKAELPVIDRILDVPTPIIHNGKLVWIGKEYDPRFNTYGVASMPEIRPKSLAEAKALISKMLIGFCWANDMSVTNAIARLLTPMCHGLIGWSDRTPLWIFEANRPRSGKDYLAGCTGLLYEGRTNEDAPIGNFPEETKKRIMAALSAGRRFMHFANCKGTIADEGLEQAITSSVLSGRNLGKNDASADVTYANETEFSISMNMGGSYTEDLSARARFITLSFNDEDPNGRQFTNPDLHGWILENRSELLSAFAGLISYWDSMGRPNGPTPFSSFPKWAKVVGGIMTCCGLGDPCASQRGQTLTSAVESDDMQKLFEFAFEKYHDLQIERKDLYEILEDTANHGVFDFVTEERKSWQTEFGIKIKNYNQRILGGIQLGIDYHDQRRPKYRFSKIICSTGSEVTHALFQKECSPCSPCSPSNTQEGFEQQLSTADSIVKGVKKVTEVPKVDILNIGLPPARTSNIGMESGPEIEKLPDTDFTMIQIPKAVIPGGNDNSCWKAGERPQCIPPVPIIDLNAAKLN
jgi:hypothetical protein